jgi:hypothetical protein
MMTVLISSFLSFPAQVVELSFEQLLARFRGRRCLIDIECMQILTIPSRSAVPWRFYPSNSQLASVSAP